MAQKHITYILSLIVFLYFSGLYFDFGVIIVRPADLLLAGLLILIVLQKFTSGRLLDYRIRFSRIFLAFGLFVFYRLLNGIFQADLAIAIKEFTQSLLILSFSWVLARFCNTAANRQGLLDLLRKLLVASSIILFIYFVQSGQPFGFKTFGPFKHVYALAALFVLNGFLKRPSKTYLVLLAITIAILLLSGEKKGWIALSFAAIYLLGQLYLKVTPQVKGYAKLSVTVFLFVAALSLPLVLPSNAYIARQFNALSEVATIAGEALLDEPSTTSNAELTMFSSRSNISRFYVLSTALEQVQRTPVFGIGPQNLKALVRKTAPFAWMDPGAHNDYLNTLVEYGALGLVMQLLLIVLAFRYSNYLLRVTSDLQTQRQIIFFRALLIFGVVINAFFGGSDALNSLYILIPIGLFFSVNPTFDGPAGESKTALT